MGDEKKAGEDTVAEVTTGAKAEESDIQTSTEAKDNVEERRSTKEEDMLNTEDVDKAAVKIQSAYKGFRTRKKVARMRTDDGRRKESVKEDKRCDEELKLREARDERARIMKEKFEKIDDEEFRYKQERKKKLKEEKSLSIF